MTFLSELRRLGARVLAPAALAAALLAACGGGTEQVAAFKPDRLLVLGDESSMIEDFIDAEGKHDGFKYGINDRSATTTGKCLALPNFAQSVAALYGFAFEQCNPTSLTPHAFILARRHSKADDASNGLAQQVAAISNLGKTDLVMVMIGSHDLIELYERTQASLRAGRPALTNAEALAEAGRRGSAAAELINRMLATGARGLVITVPDLGLSPYAVNANLADPAASGVLGSLSAEYNAILRTSVDAARFDGRNYGLVLADDIVAAMHKLPASFLVAPAVPNVAACGTAAGQSADAVATALLGCTTTNLVAGANSGSHLWASDRHLGPSAHSRIGSQAQSRAATNPF